MGKRGENMNKTQKKIRDTIKEIEELLIRKNDQYGDSVMEPIGIFANIQVDRLQITLSPIDILRDTLNPTTKYSCVRTGICIEDINNGNYNSAVLKFQKGGYC